MALLLSAFLSFFRQKSMGKVAFCKVDLPISPFARPFMGNNVQAVKNFPPRLQRFLNKNV